MEEPPEGHDFYQRHDGPFDQPRVSLQIPHAHTTPVAPTDVQSPISLPSRKSIQLPQDKDESASSPVQKSRQLSGATRRTSRDFDVRRDGPFGRPSLAMSRRKSSGIPTSPDNGKEGQELSDEQSPAVNLETLQIVELGFEPEPPPLNYSLWVRKKSILIFWSLILLDCIAMPIALYFGLWFGTSLSPNIVFSIVTAALGGVSIVEYVLRFWRLWKKNSTCRVIGARRSYLDWFHWNFSLGWMIIMIELIVGTVPKYPPIRLLSMPVTSMLFCFGTELLIVDFLRYFQVPAPVRISSIPKGAQLRPGIYSVIEDVCAVDGSGGTAFREALNKRYEASHVFRAMLRRLGAFWAFGAEIMAVVLTILIFTIPAEAAYVIGWALPFLWAGVWVLITYYYVKKKLKEEQIAWTEEIREKMAAS